MNPALLEQKKHRLSWMPWTFASLKDADREWVSRWQRDVHTALSAYEDIVIDDDAFVSPHAHLFAEPGRTIRIGPGACIGAEVFIHGPVTLERGVVINPRSTLDGGKHGIVIGEGCRIAQGARLFAFDHGLSSRKTIRDQPVTSAPIVLGRDVWLGAGVGVTAGVTMGDGAVAAMGAVVTRDVDENAVVGGVPARKIGERGPDGLVRLDESHGDEE